MSKVLTACVAIVSIFIIGGCSSTSYVNQPASPLQVVTKAKLTPDIDVAGKIEGQATVHKLFWLFSWGPGKFAEGVNYTSNVPVESISCDTISQAKAAAAYVACVENKADFIICPRYYITTNNYFIVRSTTAKVFGYKGILNGVKKALPPESKTSEVQPVAMTQPVEMQIDKPIKVNILPTKNKISTIKAKDTSLPDSSEK